MPAETTSTKGSRSIRCINRNIMHLCAANQRLFPALTRCSVMSLYTGARKRTSRLVPPAGQTQQQRRYWGLQCGCLYIIQSRRRDNQQPTTGPVLGQFFWPFLDQLLATTVHDISYTHSLSMLCSIQRYRDSAEQAFANLGTPTAMAQPVQAVGGQPASA